MKFKFKFEMGQEVKFEQGIDNRLYKEKGTIIERHSSESFDVNGDVFTYKRYTIKVGKREFDLVDEYLIKSK